MVQMINTFAPTMRALRENRQQTVALNELAEQRRMNDLKGQYYQTQRAKTLMELAQAKQEMQQQQGLRDYLRQAQAQKRTDYGAQPGGGNVPLAELGQGGTDPDRLAFNYWKRTDPKRAQEITDRVFQNAKKLHDMGDPQAAIKMVRDKLGIDVKYRGGNEYELRLKDGRMLLIDATGKKNPKVWDGPEKGWIDAPGVIEGKEKKVGDIKGRSGEAVQLLKLMGQTTTRENITDVMNKIIKPLYGHDDGPDEIELKGDALKAAAKNMLPGDTAQDVLKRAQEFYNYVNPQYQNAEQVREAYQAGDLSKEEATEILQQRFGYQ